MIELLLLLIIILICRYIYFYESFDNTQKNRGNLYKIEMFNKLKYVNTKLYLYENDNTNSVENIDINQILNNNIESNKDPNLVSIIVPVYNASKTIFDTIGSLINQKYTNIEIIVVNDASTDDSLDKLRQINDNRIKLYNNIANYGTYKTINIGLKKSTGNYIILQGSDDYSTIDRIQKMVTKLQKSNINMIYSNWLRGKRLQKCKEGSFMFKRSILKELGFFDNNRYGGDTEFLRRYKLRYGIRNISYINDILNVASIRKNSLTNSKNTYYNSNGKSLLRKIYSININRYHNNIKKTRNYFMPFLNNKKNYKELKLNHLTKKQTDHLLKKNNKTNINNKQFTDVYLQDIGVLII